MLYKIYKIILKLLLFNRIWQFSPMLLSFNVLNVLNGILMALLKDLD